MDDNDTMIMAVKNQFTYKYNNVSNKIEHYKLSDHDP